MTTPQRGDGSYGLQAADHVEARGRLLDLPVATLCGACEDWKHYGPVAEGKAAFAAHQREAHPERVSTLTRKQRRDAARNAPKEYTRQTGSEM